MTEILLTVLLALFVAKICWNLAIPFVLAARTLSSDSGLNRGISLMPWVEVVLLLVAVSVVALLGPIWCLTAGRIGLWCGVLVIASYANLFLGGAVAGWIVSRIRRRRTRFSPPRGVP
jgi:hypothetical protein